MRKNSKIIDMTGKRIGNLTVIRYAGNNKNGKAMWECKCDCGNTATIYGRALRKGEVQSCGCMSTSHKHKNEVSTKDIVGKHFGRWEVLSYLGVINGRALCECRCECGTVRNVRVPQLVRGLSKSCGCWPREKAKETAKARSHGETHERLYRIWAGIKQRCLNPNNNEYRLYGGRGISLCDEWMKYEPFRDWALASGYNNSLSIDRIDVNGNYEPSNCKWSTKQEQNRNRQYTFYVTYHGETKPLFEWADILGKDYKRLYNRIKYSGFSAERAFEEPFKTDLRKKA